MNHKSKFIQDVCEQLLAGDKNSASQIAQKNYSFVSAASAGRKHTVLESTCIFIRDGFIDRYSGDRLVFPGVLRLVSRLLPEEFPFHPNWKMSQCHMAYWELFPTIDHIVPVARGGTDDETNWATTSMLRNSAKSNWTIAELGWKLLPPENFNEWDGLVGWFVAYLARDRTHLEDRSIKRWYNAAIRAVTAA